VLELDDIQHFLLKRPPALAAQYVFLTLREPGEARRWLAGLIDKVDRASAAPLTTPPASRWATVAFTWSGLRALGVQESALATFPQEFREGMAARAQLLGDTGANHPDHWVGNLASPDLHAIVVLSARDVAARERCARAYRAYAARFPCVRLLSTLALEPTPPLDHTHDHFGYRDPACEPAIEGTGEASAPGSGAPVKHGELLLGYPGESADQPVLPQPEILFRNGSFLAYRRLQEHVGAFRGFLARQADTPEGQEWIAAKLMGRWRSGAPVDADPQLTRRPMIRCGGTYGSPLPEGASEDGVERGTATFVGCSSLIRQFESTGLRAFTTVKGGAYFFLPGLTALRFLAGRVGVHDLESSSSHRA
jgi:deferrochelatase/peroxidase EfeB